MVTSKLRLSFVCLTMLSLLFGWPHTSFAQSVNLAGSEKTAQSNIINEIIIFNTFGSPSESVQTPRGAAKSAVSPRGRTKARSPYLIVGGNNWMTAGTAERNAIGTATVGEKTKLSIGVITRAAPNPIKPRRNPATSEAMHAITRPSMPAMWMIWNNGSVINKRLRVILC